MISRVILDDIHTGKFNNKFFSNHAIMMSHPGTFLVNWSLYTIGMVGTPRSLTFYTMLYIVNIMYLSLNFFPVGL